MSEQQKKHPAPAYLDDDLDDLDDVLDQFDTSNLPISSPTSPPSASSTAPTTAPTTTTFNRPRTNTRIDAPPQSIPGSGKVLHSASEEDEDALSAEFARELAEGMENLMKEITGGNQSEGDQTEAERARAFKAAWEAMLVEGLDGTSADGGLPDLGQVLGQDGVGPSTSNKAGGETTGFQDKIKQAMDKLKESESKVQADSNPKPGPGGAVPIPQTLEGLLASLGDTELGDDEDEGELAGFLENMMGQLMSKDVLYEPLKELADGFPPYLANPPSPLSPEDKVRFEKQLACVKRILAVFDDPSYSDGNGEKSKVVVDLMSEMQAYGSPPNEIMGPLPPGFDGAGGMPQLGEEGCTTV